MRPTPALILTLATAAAWTPAWANDSIAELSTGGLIMTHSADVGMDAEVLAISPTRIAVDYVFRNRSGRDVTATVAFPMPPVQGRQDLMDAIPEPDHANWLGFSVTQDGRPIQAEVEGRATLEGGRDVTAVLREAGVPPMPFGKATDEALAALPPAVAERWQADGLVDESRFDAGKGWQTELIPLWTGRQVWHWQTSFPAGRPVRVSHRYAPSVGQTVGMTFVEDGKPQGDTFTDYQKRYCMDDAFLAAVMRRSGGDPMKFHEQRISYVLGTGGNWAGGRIGDFTLTVDKGRTDALVSFCGTGITKIGPTTFRMHATDYRPPEMLDILILVPAG